MSKESKVSEVSEMSTSEEFERAVKIIKGLLKGRVDSYEIFLSKESGTSVEARAGAVDSLKVRSSSGAGVRTIKDGRPGFSYSSVLTDEALTAVVDSALGAGSHATVDEFLCFAEPGSGGKVAEGVIKDLFDEDVSKTTEAEKLGIALEIEKSAMEYDKRVKRVRKASFSDTVVRTRTVNSQGVDSSYGATFFTGSVMAVAEGGGDSQMGWEMGMGHRRSELRPTDIGAKAGERAVAMLEAKTPGTLKTPAVFENTVALELLSALSSSLLGDNVLKGKSMLDGKTGKKIASASLNIIDDGTLPGGWATSAADSEGALRRRTPLIREGTLEGFLYDTYWGKRAGVPATGNAARGGFKSPPSVGTSNIFIEGGGCDLPGLSALLKTMDKGLFITELLGAHTIDPISGDFSIGASGFMVEEGVKAYPIRGLAISGNLLQLLSRVEEVGSDLRFLGSVGAPSLLVSEIDASGS